VEVMFKKKTGMGLDRYAKLEKCDVPGGQKVR
jgi:hypothetical protein